MSPFYYSEINLFLIGYARCKLYNIWSLLVENKSRKYHYTAVSHCKKNIVEGFTQDRVIDDNFKRQIDFL